MKTFTVKQITNWEKTQKWGKLKYSIIIGIIFGVFVTLITPFFKVLLDLAVDGITTTFTEQLTAEYTSGRIMINLVVFLIIGQLLSRHTWNTNEKRYKHTIELKEKNI